jgi:TonB family protein
MKRIPFLAILLLLLVSSAGAQSDPSDWHRYTVKNEKFSVALPAQPSFDHQRRQVDARRERLEITLSVFADGVVYLIRVFENPSPRQSLESFIGDHASSGYRINPRSKRDLTVEGVDGKIFLFSRIDGAAQFFSKGNRLYQFAAFGAPQDDARVTRFFSSVSLVNNKDAFKLPDEMPSTPATTSGRNTSEKIFTPKEVDKTHQPILMFPPEYTEAARQAKIEGTVVLKCTLSANGQITSISVVSGLPHGLTERAIAAARKLKFIPAMKDGKYVSISTQMVMTFKLF